MGAYERQYIPEWVDLGHALPGLLGDPILSGSGSLVPGTPVTITLNNAWFLTSAILILGSTELNAPFKGGVMVPTLDFVFPPLPTGIGPLELSVDWPAGIPSGTDFIFQYWILDEFGPNGFSASNGLRLTTP
jgi:hypothetical protein